MAKPPNHDLEAELDALHEEPDDAPEFNTLQTDEGPVASPRSMNRGYVFFLFLLASLLGGTIGWLGPKLSAATDPVAVLEETSRAQFADLNTALETKESEIKSLRVALEREQKSKTAADDTLNALDNRISALENTNADDDSAQTEFTALKARLDALEGLSVLGAETQDGTNTPARILIDRIDALEAAIENGTISTELSAIKSDVANLQNSLSKAPAFPKPETDPIQLPEMETHSDREQALLVLLETFPREKMIEAVQAQEQLAAKRPSWLKRVLSQHVKVRDDHDVNPVTIINEAKKSVQAGHIDIALKQIGKLNPPVRAVASKWIKAAKAFENSKI